MDARVNERLSDRAVKYRPGPKGTSFLIRSSGAEVKFDGPVGEHMSIRTKIRLD